MALKFKNYRISKRIDSFFRSFVNAVIFENATTFFSLNSLLLILFLFRFSDKLSDYHKMSVVLTFAGSMSILMIFIVNHRTTTIRYYSEKESSIFKLEQNNIELISEVQNSDYKELNISNGKFYSYELIAHQSLKLCSEIFEEQLWASTLRDHFIPLFERVRKIHWHWFKDNSSLFKRKFVRFIKNAEWRNALNPSQADQLRWIYEIEIYEHVVLSPLHPDLHNRLFKSISKIIDDYYPKEEKIEVIDLGCGQGILIEFLLSISQPSLIKGIDYSPAMVAKARQRIKDKNSNCTVNIINSDLRDLSSIQDKFDIAFSINSLLPRNFDDLPIMLQQISEKIKNGGLFIAILPSFETVVDLMNLDIECEKERLIKQGNPNASKVANKKIKRKYKSRYLDIKKGVYADDGANPQRFFKEAEINSLFSEVSLSTKKLEKFYYPWEICKAYGWGYHPDKNETVYDWLFVAQKR